MDTMIVWISLPLASLPDREAREQILLKKTKQTRLAEDVDIKKLAKRTVGLSGAELESLINVAAMKVCLCSLVKRQSYPLGIGKWVSSYS